MAEALALSRHAPVQVISALAADQPEVAAVVLARSPLLKDADLIERVVSGATATQCLIADRPAVSMELSAAIAEVGEADACRALVANHGAHIAALSLPPHGRTPRPHTGSQGGPDRRPPAAGGLPPHAAGQAWRGAEGLAAGGGADGADARRPHDEGRLHAGVADADRRDRRARISRRSSRICACAAT